MLIPTFSPQGDGNLNLRRARSRFCALLIPTFSPQGDGNEKVSLSVCLWD